MRAAVRAALFNVEVVASLLAPTAAHAASADLLKPAASNAALQPVVAANPSNDLATKDMTTIVLTGQDLPVAPREEIGVYVKSFAQVRSSAGWIAGYGTGAGWFTPDCFVVIGSSTRSEIVLGVGGLAVT